jgi:hypothetical protein
MWKAIATALPVLPAVPLVALETCLFYYSKPEEKK